MAISRLALRKRLLMLSALSRPRAIRRSFSVGSSGGRMKTDRKSTRLNSSHLGISYAVFCLKKKKTKKQVASLADNLRLVVIHLLMIISGGEWVWTSERTRGVRVIVFEEYTDIYVARHIENA